VSRGTRELSAEGRKGKSRAAFSPRIRTGRKERGADGAALKLGQDPMAWRRHDSSALIPHTEVGRVSC
jgi:hypothetical protein